MSDPYEILGVSSDATKAEIKRSYRTLARERHPDLDKDNPWAEDEFKTISVAYDILSNEKTRAQYDRGEINGLGIRIKNGAQRNHQKTHSAHDSRNSKPKSPRPEFKVNGADVAYALTLSHHDASKGGLKHISTTNGKRLKVKVPKGIKDGRTLRLKGQGIPGFGGGFPGDAMVEITVTPDPIFRQEESDVFLDVSVTLPEAVLGARIDVPTLDGKVTLTIPPASNTGTILRLKGKGLPIPEKAGETKSRGDQFVTLQVVLPKKQDKEFTDFIKSWSEKNTYEVPRRRVDTT